MILKFRLVKFREFTQFKKLITISYLKILSRYFKNGIIQDLYDTLITIHETRINHKTDYVNLNLNKYFVIRVKKKISSTLGEKLSSIFSAISLFRNYRSTLKES